jgi:hypothetical protein
MFYSTVLLNVDCREKSYRSEHERRIRREACGVYPLSAHSVVKGKLSAITGVVVPDPDNKIKKTLRKKWSTIPVWIGG